jgi:hypothetical protein
MFFTVIASHSHPVSTGWSNEAVQPANRFNGFVAAVKPLKRLKEREVSTHAVTRLKPGVNEKSIHNFLGALQQ